MIENGMRYLRGYVKIQIQGYSPERFLNLCSYHHILIIEKINMEEILKTDAVLRSKF